MFAIVISIDPLVPGDIPRFPAAGGDGGRANVLLGGSKGTWR